MPGPTFEIRIRPGNPGKFTVDVTGPSGKHKELERDLPTAEFAEYLLKIQRSYSKSGTSSRGIEPTQWVRLEPKTLESVGAKLHEMIFQSEVLDMYEEGRVNAINTQIPLRIKLRNEVQNLCYIPWELIFDPKFGRYLSCDYTTPLTRGVEFEDLDIARNPPISILCMAARPITIGASVLDVIDADAEQTRITSAFEGLEEKRLVELSWITSSSAEELNSRLDIPPEIEGNDADGKKGWDVFHFIGHGGVSDDGKGYLIVQEEGGSTGSFLYADELAAYLVRPHGPKLVVLNSCSGAQAKPGELFSNTAETLVRAGIPAVVAMQAEISDEAAIGFCSAFYTSLAQGYAVQHALVTARLWLKMPKNFPQEWPIPVLYLRGDGGLVGKF